MADSGERRFGEQPLAQTTAAAAAIRRLSAMVLSLEHAHPTVDAMLRQFADWERELAADVPVNHEPRLDTDDSGKRIYLQHAFDIGGYNPCFPEYRFDDLGPDAATGGVTFPLVFEGPPGLVHGGFLGVFFDCVTQHHSCAVGKAGKTRSLTVTYRRPTPLETPLRFDIARSEAERGIVSTARLLLDGEVLCSGEAATVALPPERLSANRYGRRREH